ncbi:MAG TPA: SPOR domain-containing protein [Bryobacteraceae bacterium]|nr:SPOR domain-containing protein [Bryobacteraceae bacterium]
MARNDEGEFELVLGNRQLISVFLIVVILLGVFFSMGYIVGRNSSPTEAARSMASAKTIVEPAETPPPVTTAAPPPAPALREPKATTPEHVTTHAEQPPVEAPAPKPTPVSPAKEKRSPSPPPAPARSERASVTGEPPPGDYWQVVATARPDAEIVAEALGKKGMHAIVAPAPKEGIFRVLVGPLKDSATQAQTRTDLEAAGFKNPIVRKY